MDTYDIILAITKFVAIAAAAAFGTLGIIHDFKDENKKITKWGRIAIWGVIASALLSTGSQALEVLKAKNDLDEKSKTTRAEIARSNELLYGIRRTLERVDMQKASFDFGLFFSIDDPAFDGYRKRLEAIYAQIKYEADNNKQRLIEKPIEKIRLLRIGEANKSYDILTIFPGSPYWPDIRSPQEISAENIINGFGIILHFTNPKYQDPRDDLDMVVGGRFDGRQIQGGNNFRQAILSYDTKRRKISIHVTGAVNTSPINTSEAFLSVPDFEDTEVSFQPAFNYKLVPSVTLGEFRVNFGANARGLIAEKDVKKSQSDDMTTFSFRLVSKWYRSTTNG